MNEQERVEEGLRLCAEMNELERRAAVHRGELCEQIRDDKTCRPGGMTYLKFISDNTGLKTKEIRKYMAVAQAGRQGV